MNVLNLNSQENQQIDSLLSTLIKQYQSPCENAFLLDARVLAKNLPERLLKKMNAFRCLENHNGTLLLKGFQIDNQKIGLTPDMVGKEIDELSALREGYMLMLLASFLGDAIGWSDQRNGALINNILPLKEHQEEQLSTGSVIDLDWHVEEAFHPFRADYLGLMCIRNVDQIPTTVGSIENISIDDQMKKILFEPRFIFLTDKNFQNGKFNNAIPEPVLFGDYSTPYIKIDPSFMKTIDGDTAAAEALNHIINEFKKTLHEIALQQGDILFIDNYRVVHGRKSFQPRFDGTDRWLKRINIALDFRKSRTAREHQNSHVINTH